MSEGVRARSRTSLSEAFTEIELEDAEIARVRSDEVFEDSVAAALAEKGFIAHQHISRPQLAGLQFGEKAVGLAEGAH